MLLHAVQKKSWLNFRQFGPAGSEDNVVNKSGDIAKIAEPIIFDWHLHDLTELCDRTATRTRVRVTFNVITLASNENAKPKFSLDYINDIEKWPRTPLELGENPRLQYLLRCART